METSSRTVREPAREIPLVAEVEVGVVGGGTAGVMAALGAARAGARVAVLERLGNVGGMLSSGLMGHFGNRFRDQRGRDIIDGAPRELLGRIIAAGAAPFATVDEALNADDMLFYRHEHAGNECLRMLEEAGVELWLHAYVAGAAPAPNGGYDLAFESKGGRLAIRARQVVDASGEADVARRLGAPIREDVRRRYSWGLLFEMGLVDLDRYGAFLATCKPDCPEWTPWLAATLGLSEAALARDAYWGEWLDRRPRAWPFRPQIMQAVDAGDLDLVRTLPEGGSVRYGWDGFWPEPWHGPDVVHANVCMVTGLDPSNGRHVSVAEAGARRYAFDFVGFLRKHIPGFERAVVRAMSAQTVPRGGIEIVGEAEAGPQGTGNPAPAICLSGFGAVGLPLGMFVPQGVPDLLVAGRCADHGYAFRPSVSCMAQGYSCGVIAAMAARRRVTPSRLDPAEWQAALRQHGVLLDPGAETGRGRPPQPRLPGVPSHDRSDGAQRARKLS